MPEADGLRIAGLYRDIFEIDKRGQVIYEDLYKRFAAPARVHVKGGLDAVLATYRDGARREVVEHIVRMCNIANGAEPADEPPTSEGNDHDLP